MDQTPNVGTESHCEPLKAEIDTVIIEVGEAFHTRLSRFFWGVFPARLILITV